MSHIEAQPIHANRKRADDLQIDVETTATPEQVSNITFRITGQLTKESLQAEAGGSGLLIDLTLTAENLDFTPGAYPWECYATIGGEVRTLARGIFYLDPEPTEDDES